MTSPRRPHAPAPGLALLFAAGLALSGCLGGGAGSGFFGIGGSDGGNSGANAAASAEDMTQDEQAALRKLVGPSYCPRLRIPRGGEAMRNYEKGHEDDPAFVTWQATVSETARECEYDGLGNLTIKIGVSGRLLIGPVGQPGPYTLPLKVMVEKYKEAVLHEETYQVNTAVGPEGSTVFRQVIHVTVPSPGGSRDYLISVGFPTDEPDDKGVT